MLPDADVCSLEAIANECDPQLLSATVCVCENGYEHLEMQCTGKLISRAACRVFCTEGVLHSIHMYTVKNRVLNQCTGVHYAEVP